mgnify:CR=1 FL=1
MVLKNILQEQKTANMLTKTTNLSSFNKEDIPNAKGFTFGIVVSQMVCRFVLYHFLMHPLNQVVPSF